MYHIKQKEEKKNGKNRLDTFPKLAVSCHGNLSSFSPPGPSIENEINSSQMMLRYFLITSPKRERTLHVMRETPYICPRWIYSDDRMTEGQQVVPNRYAFSPVSEC